MTTSNLGSQALLLIDPLNDFLANGGKLWPYARELAEQLKLIDNLKALLAAARESGTLVVYVPHQRYSPTDFDGWKFLNPSHARAKQLLPFLRGSWGADWYEELRPRPGDVIAHDHWLHDGFMHTDLDFQLQLRGIDRLIIAGMRTNTCVEATARHGVELGYHVSIVKDATATFRWEEWRATIEANAPTFAHGLPSTVEALAALLGSAGEALAPPAREGAAP